MVLTDAQWIVRELLIQGWYVHHKTQHHDLRRTMEAILWCQNDAKWRSIPAEPGPWCKAKQTFIGWTRLGAGERLLGLAHEKGVQLAMVFLDGTDIRAHHKAAGAAKKAAMEHGMMRAKLLGDLVAAMAPKPV